MAERIAGYCVYRLVRHILVLACLLIACAPSPTPAPTPRVFTPARGDLSSYFDRAPDFPGYAWMYNGQPIDTTHGMNTIAGPEHCDWQAATIMHLPWPLGTTPTSAAGVRQFIRDPKHVTPQRNLRGILQLHATLPADAFATGYRYQAIEVYVSPSDQDDAVYVVGPGAIERWQRSDPMTLCS